MQIFSKDEINQKLSTIENWKIVDGALERSYNLADFKEALQFINNIGQIAEAANHHPELYNVYNKLVIRLRTHDVDGITDKDFDLAKKISKLR